MAVIRPGKKWYSKFRTVVTGKKKPRSFERGFFLEHVTLI